MNKTLLLTFLTLALSRGYCQDSLTNAICEELTSKYSDELNTNERMRLYLTTISPVLNNLEDSLKKEFIENLDSSCPIVDKLKVKQKSLALNPVSEEDLLNDLLKRKSDKKWKKEELKIEIKKLKSLSNETEEFCKEIIAELSKHMNYSDYKSLTEFQQGKTIGRLFRYMKK